MKTAYSFVRWSTSRQNSVEKQNSKKRQLLSAEKWCADNGYILSKDVFVGDGESAYKAKHLQKKDGIAVGALALFIEAVETGKIKTNNGSVALCIDSVDRFTRQEILDALEPFTKLLNLGIGIVFTGSPLKTLLTRQLINKEPHWLQIIIQDMTRSWMESAEKSRKVKDALKRKHEAIRDGKPVPHNNAPKYFSWNKAKQVYEHNEKTLIVKRLVKMFLDGNTMYSIARTLNAEKVPTVKTDSAWSANGIRCILKNRALIGEFLGAQDFFPSIIEDETFNQVQALLAQNPSFNKGKPGTLINVFRGTAFCVCGRSMNVLVQRKNPRTKEPYANPHQYRYLRCSSQGTGKNCEHTYVMPLRDMEEEFFGNFLLRDPKELVADKSAVNELTIARSKVQLQISKLDKQINEWMNDDDKISIALIKSKVGKLEADKGERQAELDSINLHLSKIQMAPGHFDDIKKLCIDYDADDKTTIDETGRLHLSPKAKAFDAAIERMNETLQNNEVRKKIKSVLPTLIGKIVVDTRNRSFEVFNHSGASIYQSIEV